MNDLRNELLTYTKDQLIELQNLLLRKIERIKAEMYMTASPDGYVSYRYNKAMAELALVDSIFLKKFVTLKEEK